MIMSEDIKSILKNALAEDLGTAGDITSQAIFGAADTGEAVIRSKETGIVSGVSLIAPLFELVDGYLPSAPAQPTAVELLCADGNVIESGKLICKIKGPVRSILSGERTILNLLQSLSGIATATSRMIEVIKSCGSKTRLLDTRKTTPCMRALEKAAVRHGGGGNHRFGLYDMILIKDTHVKRAGGVKPALEKALSWRGTKREPLIEIEVQSTDEFFEALPLEPDRIMLDNMGPHEIEACVRGRNASGLNVELEASGGISVSSLSAIAATNVDFVSSGAITHSAPVLDIHLIMQN
jgi:nicotinate-nucleotide pyrophosphorylase (carboxylating)